MVKPTIKAFTMLVNLAREWVAWAEGEAGALVVPAVAWAVVPEEGAAEAQAVQEAAEWGEVGEWEEAEDYQHQDYHHHLGYPHHQEEQVEKDKKQHKQNMKPKWNHFKHRVYHLLPHPLVYQCRN